MCAMTASTGQPNGLPVLDALHLLTTADLGVHLLRRARAGLLVDELGAALLAGIPLTGFTGHGGSFIVGRLAVPTGSVPWSKYAPPPLGGVHGSHLTDK
ncbi:hypothetical protein BN381_290151 [Candidatus Microthrix parvicella RN1]|uniref:Uncharacterized protein n=1 Tax=Candidatus Neomicrothrix parvicella RN1 TaxID=1229780 RepID=R4YZC2_9ACTN|nr:hypothetical protein BN381_290151 [Candidatus Microthrix parvicella RN1]